MPEAEMVPVAAVVVGRRVRKEVRNLPQLSESIRVLGLLHPIVVNERNELVAGFRRLQAVKKLGHTEVAVRRIASLGDAVMALQAERDENTCRESLTMSEMVEVGRLIEELERPAAAKRLAAAGPKSGRGAKPTGPGKFPGPVGDTRDKVGKALGVSGKTYEKAKAVVAAAEAEPERFEPVRAEMDRTGKVDPAFRIVKKSPVPAEGRRDGMGASPPPPASEAPRPLSLLAACELVLSKVYEAGDGPRVVLMPADVLAVRSAVNAHK